MSILKRKAQEGEQRKGSVLYNLKNVDEALADDFLSSSEQESLKLLCTRIKAKEFENWRLYHLAYINLLHENELCEINELQCPVKARNELINREMSRHQNFLTLVTANNFKS